MTIGKKLGIGLILLIALYGVGRWGYGKISYAYFQHKCETDAGEFIYRTVDNVEGLYQMRPRDPRDYFDRLRYGDIPEDPYGHTNSEAQRPWHVFVSPPTRNYVYLETTKKPNMDGYEYNIGHLKFSSPPKFTGEKYWTYTYDVNGKFNKYEAIQTDKLKSKYGFDWRETRDKWDELLGVYEGELIVKELADDDILGVRRGYFYLNNFSKRAGICPKDKNDYSTYTFVSKVLLPFKSE